MTSLYHYKLVATEPMTFSELLKRWLELRAKGPPEEPRYDPVNYHRDKALSYERNLAALEMAMDKLAPGRVTVTLEEQDHTKW